MTFSRHLVPAAIALAGLLMAGGAFAQLKLPGGSAAGTGGGMSAPASPAPASPGPAAAGPGAEPASATTEMEDAARLAASGWLLLLDRKDWGTAWDTSAAMFRSTVPLPAWMDGIPKARQPLGALVERTPVAAVYKTQLEGRPQGHYVTVVFNSRFDKKPDAQEIVTTVREPDGKWRVTGYSTR